MEKPGAKAGFSPEYRARFDCARQSPTKTITSMGLEGKPPKKKPDTRPGQIRLARNHQEYETGVSQPHGLLYAQSVSLPPVGEPRYTKMRRN